MISIPQVLSGISIILLVGYGIDVLIKMNSHLEPIPDPAIRWSVFGILPIILSFIAFFMAKRPPFKGLGIMLLVTGIMILIGGIILLPNSNDEHEYSKWLVTGGVVVTIGITITIFGIIKLKKHYKK